MKITKFTTTAKLPKKISAEVNDPDNPAWIEDMLGAPALKRGRERDRQRVSVSHQHRGACLCGGVQFNIEGPLSPIQVCHCAQCRRAQGGPFATNIPVDKARLSFLSGAGLLKRFESSPGKFRVFCAHCGSPILSERAAAPAVVRIRAGLLQEPVEARPGFHAHVASQCSWWPIQDDLPQHAQGHVSP